MGDGWDGIPADVFMSILRLIPPSPRRRLRLVCRHWRNVIDERSPEPRAHAKVLAFFSGYCPARAFILDDLPGRHGRELDLPGSGASMIGTCNGLLCLKLARDNIAVINSVTREMITVNPPNTLYREQESTYSFGYHPATGQYKILHVPYQVDAVHVFTLGDASWRQVPAPAGSSCRLHFGFVTIGGVTYWITMDAERIMWFDLKDDRVALVECPPMPVQLPTDEGYRPCHLILTDVRGMLGIAVYCPRDEFHRSKTEVWVLEGAREVERTWVKRITVLAHGMYPRQEIASPHVVHGEHVLTTGEVSWWNEGRKLNLNAHLPLEERKMRPCLMVRIGALPRPDTVVGLFDGWRLRTFAYVETLEPVLVYGDGLMYDDGCCCGDGENSDNTFDEFGWYT